MSRLPRSVLMMAFALVGFGEDIPESIRKGEWQYKWNGTRLHPGIPDYFWSQVTRGFITVRISEAELKTMASEKTLDAFVLSKISSLEDIFKVVYGEKLGEWNCGELAPTPTTAQQAWAASLTKTWLPPVPDGYVVASEGGGLDAWNKWAWSNTSRIKVIRGCVPKKSLGVTGGPSDEVFWYDRPMTDDDMLIEVASYQSNMKIIKEHGQYIAEHRNWGQSDDWRYVSWPSGQFMIRLEMPDRLYRQQVKAYLEKYPSRWRDLIEYDPKSLILRVMDQELRTMITNIDGPLEWVRYSFRTYPFDDAFRRIIAIMPRSGSVAPKLLGPHGRDWLGYHKDSIEVIHAAWVKAPASELMLSDYRDAMTAYRRDLINKLSAVRAVIARDGVGFGD
jgi:hypothetical protein